jgi:hypothetical protein
MAVRSDILRSNGSSSNAHVADFDTCVAAESARTAEGRAFARSNAIGTLPHRPQPPSREASESRERGEELKAHFEKSTRRVQQLIGERDRLILLLAERDAELQRLNREVGALTAHSAPPVRGSSALLTAARAMLEKIREARKVPFRARSNTSPAQATQQPSAGRALVPWIKNGPPKAVLGVAVFGLSEAEIERVLDVVEGYCAGCDLAPLLLTDNDAFQLFRGRRVLFEFLPPRSEQERLAPDLDWRLVTLRRLALIRRKWQPVRVVAFGRTAAEVVQLWLDSPFEATPIPAPMKGQGEDPGMAWSPVRQAEALQP